jgi:ATP-grasp domain
VRSQSREIRCFAVSGSVAEWLPVFLDPRDAPAARLFAPDDPSELRSAAPRRAGGELVFVSDHDTLERDARWARLLRSEGHQVRAQTESALRVCLDKTAMKRLLAAHRIPTLPWRTATEASPGWRETGPETVKKRRGTQSQGIRIGAPGEPLGHDEYSEPFAYGTEYSVNVFTLDGASVLLPPVWKGHTNLDLVPPWRKARACGPELVDPVLAAELTRITRRVVDAIRPEGFAEIEFLVTEEGTVAVLEINPRVSGTLRGSALAAGEPVFSWYGRPPRTTSVPATACSLEVPNTGPHLLLPRLGVYATGRLTLSAATYPLLADRVAELRDLVTLSGPTIHQLDEGLAALRGPADVVISDVPITRTGAPA